MLDINEQSLNRDDFKMILDNSFDEIFVVNSKGIVTYVNKVCKKHYGLDPSEIIGKNVSYLLSEGYYSPALAPIVFQNKQTVTVEQQTKTGIKLVVTATPVINKDGEVDFIVMNSRDITQLEELKQDLDKTKNLLNITKAKSMN